MSVDLYNTAAVEVGSFAHSTGLCCRFASTTLLAIAHMETNVGMITKGQIGQNRKLLCGTLL